MTYSCSDMADDVIARMVALNLVTDHDVRDIDPKMQAVLCIETLTSLSDKVAVLGNLLNELVDKLPANDAQATLPLDGSTICPIEPMLRDRIVKVLGAEAMLQAIHGPAARFMAEVLDAHDSVAGIVDQYNDLTLADVLYLHSAIHKKSFIEIETPTDSCILELVRQLPSADFWQQHIYVLAEQKAA